MVLHSLWMHLVHWAIAFGAGGNPPPMGELPPNVSWQATGPYRYILEYKGNKYPFNLVDPEEAPAALRNQVLQGYRIFNDPKKYASQYAGDALTCSNCHFSGGNTLGSINGGISLVGVTATYPRYEKRFNRSLTLQQRIQSCFERSLNGSPPPVNSPEMKALVAYLAWISSETQPLPVRTWLGIKPLKTQPKPDLANGEKEYLAKCAACHRPGGEGAPSIPPLWGSSSFNDAAGMNQLHVFAAFIKSNMPKDRPDLTDQQAMDIAAYVTSKPRDKFEEE